MKTIVLTGRYGDIISLMPLLTEPVSWIVKPAFADIMISHPFICPAIYRGPIDPPKVEGGIICQVHRNPNPWPRHRTVNYQHESACRFFEHQLYASPMEQYSKAEILQMLMEKPLKIYFRHQEFEQKVIDLVFKTRMGDGIPLLVNLNGFSSAFPYIKEGYMYRLRRYLGKKYAVIDLDGIWAKYFTNMIGLLEAVQNLGGALLTIDTGLLHLGYACRIPTIALVNDDLWLASLARPHWILRLPYRDAERYDLIEQALEEHL